MAGLLEQMQRAQQAQQRGLLSHTPSNRPTRNQVGRGMADALQSAGLLTAPIPVVGDAVGLLGDAAMYAAKPEERTWGNAAFTALGALPFVPSVAGKIGKASKAGKSLDMSDAARSARMTEQDYTPGMWRGGRSIADGPWYTPDPAQAAEYGARHGSNPDVREYALRLGKQFNGDDGFGPEDLKRFADILRTQYKNTYAAKELPLMASDFRSGKMPAAALMQVLDAQTGGNATDVLRAAGYDSARFAEGTIMLQPGNVRDAKSAAFDPRHLGKVGPFLGLTGLGLLGGAVNEDSSR
jgi:hypothetical protein